MIDLDIVSLRQGYRKETFTPEDVVVEIRERIELTRSHNIWITLLDAADLAVRLDNLKHLSSDQHALWGIPFAIKDNIDLAGCPTTAGCPDFTYTPDSSASVVSRLIAAGAIPIGKTNLDQFATGLVGTRSPYGAVGNAVNPQYIAGGSSAGSAVAVRLGLCSFALGTDTAGSGRIPAGFNGIVGLKPTRGWWSTRGVVPACMSLDCVSVFTRSVTDARIIAGQCAGMDDDPWSRDIEFAGFNINVPRVGVIGGPDLEVCDAASGNAYTQFIDNLPFERVTIDMEPFTAAAQLLYEGPWVAERYAAIDTFIQSSPQSLHPITLEIIDKGAELTAVDAFNGSYRLEKLKSVTDKVFDAIDVLLLPTAPTIFSIKEVMQEPIQTNSRLGVYSNFVNLLDLCALSIPAGTLTNGLPFGVTLIAKAGRDHALLDLAALLRGEAISSEPRPGEFHLAVCGAHLSGQPLNQDLVTPGGYLIDATRTSSDYRLYALPDGKRPALVRDPGCGCSIEVEVWSLPDHSLADFVRTIAPPLGIGSIELMDGRWVHSFIAEPVATENAQEITHYGGWRKYKTDGSAGLTEH